MAWQPKGLRPRDPCGAWECRRIACAGETNDGSLLAACQARYDWTPRRSDGSLRTQAGSECFQSLQSSVPGCCEIMWIILLWEVGNHGIFLLDCVELCRYLHAWNILKLCRYRTLPRSELWEKAVAWSQAHWCYLQAYSIDQQQRSGRLLRFNDGKSVLGVTHLVLLFVMQRLCDKLWTFYAYIAHLAFHHTWSHLLTPGLAAAAHSISGFAKSRGWIATGH